MNKELPINTIVCGDALEVMKAWPAESIDMCMTSPPYWGLRDYGVEQIFGGDKKCEHEWVGEKKDIKRFDEYESGKSRNEERFFGDDPTRKFYGQHEKHESNVHCLKCQAWKGQLGLEPMVEMYIEHMTEVFNEVKRVLKKEGSLWLNISDTYGGSNTGHTGPAQTKWKAVPRGEGKSLQGKLMPKCLLMIPERLAWSLIQNGWIFRNRICWYKPNAMPSSVKDRFSNRWEYLFFFVKSDKSVYWTNRKTGGIVTKQPFGIKGLEGLDWEWKEVGVVNENVFNVRVRDADKERFLQKATEKEKEKYGKSKLKKVSFWTAHDYYFDLDAVREPHKYDGRKDTLYKGGPKDMQIGKHERWPNPAGKNPGDVIKVERKWNEVPGQESQSIARDHAGWFRKDGSPIVDFEKGKNPGDFWNINTQPFPEAHFAVFPEKLCEKPIKAGCPEEVCKKCGKARVRIVEKEKAPPEVFTNKNTPPDAHTSSYVGGKMRGQGQKLQNWREAHPPKTIGWTSCDCNAGFNPGIILDPFCGAGTAGVMAKKLGRRFILIDIKKEYCEMAEKRIAQIGYQMELI